VTTEAAAIISVDSDGPAILVEHARKDYGKAAGAKREAVSDVSISVSHGAIHGLLGPNGAGKTTTLKMLLGLVRPSGGRFEILGKPAFKAGARASVGFLPEQPYFPGQLTASEAMALYGRLAGLGRVEIKEQTNELLDRVGLDGRQKTLLSKFSRGMLQRLGLAQALLGSPEVLILDEPASGLDPVGQRDIRRLMLELKQSGRTILLSSHQLSEVEAVSDEVTILNRGTVVARGHIDQLLAVAGRVSVKARGEGELPSAVAAAASEVVDSGTLRSFTIAEPQVRQVVDGLDDAGWAVVEVAPERATLEDYFARLLGEPSTAADTPDAAVAKGGDSW
jgi:ABC-2 type transport system ATP-binding protein